MVVSHVGNPPPPPPPPPPPHGVKLKAHWRRRTLESRMASQGLEEIYTGGALCFSVLECDWVRFAPRFSADFILGEARSLAATWMKMKGHLVENGAAYSCCSEGAPCDHYRDGTGCPPQGVTPPFCLIHSPHSVLLNLQLNQQQESEQRAVYACPSSCV